MKHSMKTVEIGYIWSDNILKIIKTQKNNPQKIIKFTCRTNYECPLNTNCLGNNVILKDTYSTKRKASEYRQK